MGDRATWLRRASCWASRDSRSACRLVSSASSAAISVRVPARDMSSCRRAIESRRVRTRASTSTTCVVTSADETDRDTTVTAFAASSIAASNRSAGTERVTWDRERDTCPSAAVGSTTYSEVTNPSKAVAVSRNFWAAAAGSSTESVSSPDRAIWRSIVVAAASGCAGATSRCGCPGRRVAAHRRLRCSPPRCPASGRHPSSRRETTESPPLRRARVPAWTKRRAGQRKPGSIADRSGG